MRSLRPRGSGGMTVSTDDPPGPQPICGAGAGPARLRARTRGHWVPLAAGRAAVPAQAGAPAGPGTRPGRPGARPAPGTCGATDRYAKSTNGPIIASSGGLRACASAVPSAAALAGSTGGSYSCCTSVPLHRRADHGSLPGGGPPGRLHRHPSGSSPEGFPSGRSGYSRMR